MRFPSEGTEGQRRVGGEIELLAAKTDDLRLLCSQEFMVFSEITQTRAKPVCKYNRLSVN